MALQITDSTFDELLGKNQPMMIDFWAEWCGPCMAIADTIDELAKEYEGKIIIGKVNVDENSDLPVKFAVRNIPTLLFFKEGKLVDKHVGVAKKSELEGKLKALL